MTDDQPVAGTGTGELHLGWAVPGEVICLGVGPVHLRFSRKEAAALRVLLHSVLVEPDRLADDGGWDYTPCGCEDGTEPEVTARPVSEFWGDSEWGRFAG